MLKIVSLVSNQNELNYTESLGRKIRVGGWGSFPTPPMVQNSILITGGKRRTVGERETVPTTLVI